MTDIHGNLLWYGEYTALGRLKKYERVYKNVHQPFRLQNQYYDEETGLHYNLMRYYESEARRFVNQDSIGLLGGGDNFYKFAVNAQGWIAPLGLSRNRLATVGKTPSKVSPTGRTVMQRMLSAKELCGMTADQISSLRRISDIPRSAQFWDVPTKSWQPVRSAHMGHVGEDVVDYWNRRGKFFGQKSPEVRSWMRDSNNYRLEKGAGKGGNFSRGAQNRSRYNMTDLIGPRQKSSYGHD